MDDANELYIKIDPSVKLIAIVAIDKVNQKPGLGGTRCINYESISDAFIDAIKLSKTMTNKIKFAGLPFTGGKSVLIKPLEPVDKEQYFAAFGKFIESLNGRFITGCDSGVSQDDMKIAAKHTQYITGLPQPKSHHDDLAYLTSLGIQEAMKAAIEFKLGRKSFQGIKISIQGVGKVGYYLAIALHEQGADLTVTDIDPQRITFLKKKYNIKSVSPSEIYQVESDIFSPCGLGGIINHQMVKSFKGKIMCGAANNPLSSVAMSKMLSEMDILYIPDFIANIGGTIYAAFSYQQYPIKYIQNWILSNLYEKTLALLNYSSVNNISISTAAQLYLDENLIL